MNRIARFGEYAAAFEKAFASDDWSVLEPYFTEDAVYEVESSAPFAGRHEGREAVLSGFKSSLDGFDRRFDERRLSLLEGPEERDGRVWMRWRVTYRRAGAPALPVEGEETAEFAGDRIRRLHDRISEADAARTRTWLAEHGARLRPVGG